MSKDKISLNRGADPYTALDVARSVLERMGYLWLPRGDSSAEAHEGGKEITSRRSRKLRLAVLAHKGELVLERTSSGSEGFIVGMGATPAMRNRRAYRKAHHAIEKGLEHAGLS